MDREALLAMDQAALVDLVLQLLERVVVLELIQQSSGAEGAPPVRVWVPGCATGEEA